MNTATAVQTDMINADHDYGMQKKSHKMHNLIYHTFQSCMHTFIQALVNGRTFLHFHNAFVPPQV